jgi:hypothetical protein
MALSVTIQIAGLKVAETEHKNEEGKSRAFFEAISKDKHVSKMLDLLTVAALKTYGKDHEETRGNFFDSIDLGDDNTFHRCEKIILLIRIVERHCLSSPNVTVSLAAIKCLFSFGVTNNFVLGTRACAASWVLLKDIHDNNSNSIFPWKSLPSRSKWQTRKFETHGAGLLSPFLHDFITSRVSEDPLLTFAAASLPLTEVGVLLQMACDHCRNLQELGVVVAKKLVSKTFCGLSQAAEEESFAGFSLIFDTWWSTDYHVGGKLDSGSIPYHHVSQRIYGMFLLLAECLMQCDFEYIGQQMNPKPKPLKSKVQEKNDEVVLHPSPISVNQTPVACLPDNQMATSTSISTSGLESQSLNNPPTRTSRNRKPVKRFEPENFLRNNGEVANDVFGDEIDARESIKKRVKNTIQPKLHSLHAKSTDKQHPKIYQSRLRRSFIVVKLATLTSSSSTSSCPTSSSALHNRRVRRISETNYNAYMIFLMSHLPSLILTSRPVLPCSDDDSVDISMGPYQPFIHSVQMFSWCIDEVCELMCRDGALDDQIKEVIPLANHSMRLCRAAILATEYAINSCLHWRNSTFMKHEADGEEVVDWASADFLGEVFMWSEFLLNSIRRYSRSLTNKIMTSKTLPFPKGLTRSVPCLKSNIDKLLVKVQRWKTENDCTSIDVNNLVSQADDGASWLECLLNAAQQYDQSQATLLESSVPNSTWNMEDETFGTSSFRGVHWKRPSGYDELNQENSEKIVSESTADVINMPETLNGFGVSSSHQQSSGWGWGQDSDSSNSDNDDRNDDLEAQSGSKLSLSQHYVKKSNRPDDESNDDDDVVIDSEDSFDSDSQSENDYSHY